MRSFSQLYTTYFKDVYNFLLKLSGYQRSLAEELTQETFYQAIRSFSKFRGNCHVKTWLIQIAKNMFYTYLRKSKRDRALFQSDALHKESSFALSSPQEQFENKEFLANLLNVVHSFDDRTRDIMLYRFFSDLPYSQIAAILKISEGSAKVIYCRGRVALQNRLREEFGYEI